MVLVLKRPFSASAAPFRMFGNEILTAPFSGGVITTCFQSKVQFMTGSYKRSVYSSLLIIREVLSYVFMFFLINRL